MDKPVINCPKCNQVISQNTNFCGRCGVNIQQTASATTLPAAHAKLVNKRKAMIIIVIAIAVVIVVAITATIMAVLIVTNMSDADGRTNNLSFVDAEEDMMSDSYLNEPEEETEIYASSVVTDEEAESNHSVVGTWTWDADNYVYFDKDGTGRAEVDGAYVEFTWIKMRPSEVVIAADFRRSVQRNLNEIMLNKRLSDTFDEENAREIEFEIWESLWMEALADRYHIFDVYEAASGLGSDDWRRIIEQISYIRNIDVNVDELRGNIGDFNRADNRVLDPLDDLFDMILLFSDSFPTGSLVYSYILIDENSLVVLRDGFGRLFAVLVNLDERYSPVELTRFR